MIILGYVFHKVRVSCNSAIARRSNVAIIKKNIRFYFTCNCFNCPPRKVTAESNFQHFSACNWSRKNNDDGSGMFDKLSGPQIEQRKKKIIKLFQDCGLSITVTRKITSADFLN